MKHLTQQQIDTLAELLAFSYIPTLTTWKEEADKACTLSLCWYGCYPDHDSQDAIINRMHDLWGVTH